MGFELKKYTAPDFTKEPFVSAPDAVLAPAPKDRTAPENYHATTIFPEYFKRNMASGGGEPDGLRGCL